MMADSRKVLIFGGAGFIGSHVVKRFVEAGCPVTVVDGLVSGTGGRAANLEPSHPRLCFTHASVEEVEGLEYLVQDSEVIVDCMAWTSHWGALGRPLHDLRLNVETHLHWITLLKERRSLKAIYLGSRGQYGHPQSPLISEEAQQIPEDVQGIHKVAAESYFRVFSGLRGFLAASVRFANCFGRNQLVDGDPGLIGGFILDLINGREIVVYGQDRSREFVYAPDLAEGIYRLSTAEWRGFLPVNFGGRQVPLLELVALLVTLVGRGSFRVEPLPPEVGQIDTGPACLDDSKWRSLIGNVPRTELQSALADTVAFFGEEAL